MVLQVDFVDFSTNFEAFRSLNPTKTRRSIHGTFQGLSQCTLSLHRERKPE
jgi:hypothetical protein